MTDEQKPKIENLARQEPEELTPGEAEVAQGGRGECQGIHYKTVVIETRKAGSSPYDDPPPPPPPPPK
jgi:hypothetical protein